MTRQEPIAESQHGAKLMAPTEGRPYYRIIWYTRTGERKQGSAGRDFEEALGKLGEKEAELATGLGERGTLPFQQAIDAFLQAHANSADSYLTQHKAMVRRFVSPHLGPLPAWSLTRDDVEKVLKLPEAPSVRLQLRATLGSMLTWAYAQSPRWTAQPRSHFIVEQPRNAARERTSTRRSGPLHPEADAPDRPGLPVPRGKAGRAAGRCPRRTGLADGRAGVGERGSSR